MTEGGGLMDGKKNPLGAAFGLLFLGVFFLGGCAGISVREVSVWQSYPAAAKPPMEVAMAPGPGFVVFAEIEANYTKAGYQEVEKALMEKAQALGAQLISFGESHSSTSYWKQSYTNPVAGRPGWVQTDTWEGYRTERNQRAYLTVYDPDLARKVNIQSVSAEIGAMEKDREGHPSLKDPKTFTRPENQARWTKALADLKQDFQEGRYAAALSAAKALQSRVDGCKRTGGGGSNGKPDQDDWIADCMTQWGYYHDLDRTLAYFQKLIELQAHKKTDPENALREYQARVDKWRAKNAAEYEAERQKQFAKGEKKRKILLEKLATMEKGVDTIDPVTMVEAARYWSGRCALIRKAIEKGDGARVNELARDEKAIIPCSEPIPSKVNGTWQILNYKVFEACPWDKRFAEVWVDFINYYLYNQRDMFP
jgi:hypothetical protein